MTLENGKKTGIHRDVLKDRINKLHWTIERALAPGEKRGEYRMILDSGERRQFKAA